VKTKKSFFFLLFIFIHTLINAQVVPYERYTSKNGLISDRITAITQDEKGFMWFGSFFGICRYNGIKFEKIALHPKQQNKYVTFLCLPTIKCMQAFYFKGDWLNLTMEK
jgi:ligand-binding sensor domain-containing protein